MFMKILVHLHLHYTYMLDEMLSYIRNLNNISNCRYDLYVTLTEDNLAVETKIKQFNPQSRIELVPNRGYDVGPFIHILKQVKLGEYDYVIKLHSKQNLKTTAYLPYCKMQNNEWRAKLVSFMATPQILQQSINLLSDEKIGMVSHYDLIVAAKKEDKEANLKAKEIMLKMGLFTPKCRFVAGTMFICKAPLLKPIQDYPCAIEDFEPYNPYKKGGSLAHTFERILGYVITAQGQQIVSCIPYDFTAKCKRALYLLKEFCFYKRVNSKGRLHVKICKIPVWSKQINM